MGITKERAESLPPSPYCPTCGMGNHQNFGERVQQLLEEEEIVRRGLVHEGPRLIESAMAEKGISLREIARRIGLSPTYLSQVRNQNSVISAGAFLKIWNLWD